MIFRQDKNRSIRERLLLPALVTIFLISLFLFVPSSSDKIIGGLQYIAFSIFSEKSAVLKNIKNYRAMVSSKESLYRENEQLKKKINLEEVRIGQLKALEIENERLKELWGRKEKPNLVLAGILTRPNRSPYDTFIIDAGSDYGIKKSQRVFAYGNILIGTVKESYKHTSLVALFSSPDNVFEAKIGSSVPAPAGIQAGGEKNIILKVSGRGGGSFEAAAPAALVVNVGDAVIVPTPERTVIGYVEKILTDPRDPFVRILINSVVSLSYITEVQVEIK